MAYDKKKLSGNTGVGATVPTLYVYKSDDAIADIIGSNYFNESADIFIQYDTIMAEANDNFSILRVVSNDGTTVVVNIEETEV